MHSRVDHAATTAPESASVQVQYVSKGRCAFGHLGNLALQVWHGQADGASAIALGELADGLFAMYPGGISGIHILRGGTDLPTADARKRFAEIMRDKGPWIGEAAMVLEGGGFWASAVRGVFTGLRLAAGGRVGLRVAADLNEVMTWLPGSHLERTGVTLQPDAIARALDVLHQRCQAG